MTLSSLGNGRRWRAMLAVVALFAVLGLGWFLWWYSVLSVRQTTENAVVAGHQTLISAQVGGTVIAVNADDTQFVQAGAVLLQLDPADAAIALDRAQASLSQAVREVRQLRATAAASDALLATRRLDLAQAQADLDRRLPLLDSRAISPELITHARDRVALAQAALEAARQQTAATHAVVDGGALDNHPRVAAARAAYMDAWLGRQRTQILAPSSGVVTQRTVQVGHRVQPGAPLMRLVSRDEVWIDANFKETQLRDLRVGQPVKISVDVYGSSVSLRGKVAGFSPGTGAAFALLPAQNAAGNWVKVVQRVPVRIALEPGDLREHPLLVGLSVRISVDTSERKGPRLTSAAPNVVGPVAGTSSPGLDAATEAADRIVAASAGPDSVAR